MTKYYTVIYIDLGDSCDVYASVLGTYKSAEEAKQAMDNDIESYNQGNDLAVAIDKGDVVMLGDEEQGCQWQILEVEVPNG